MQLAELSVEESAQTAAGNWKNFKCFIWDRDNQIIDADNWAIFYTHHRDSGLLDESNASVIRKELLPFSDGDNPEVVFESHSHWAVGHVDGFSLRVFMDGEITKAFRKYNELMEQLDGYPILDETDYSNREFEATLSNIEDAAWRLKKEFALSDDWVCEVYDWLSDNESSEIENKDDQGGYPTEQAVTRAFEALKYQPI